MSIKPSKTYAEGYRGWTDLHEDILLLIKEKLKIVDQLRFRAVCKNWRSVSYLKSADQLPWILVFRSIKESAGWDGSIEDIILYDPSNRREYTTPGHKSIGPDTVISRNAYYSNFGWIFLASNLINGDCLLSLYHPFTRKTIVLPTLRTNYCGKGTFSTVPTQADCVFCVTRTDLLRWYDGMSISIYRTGDVAWRMFKLKAPGLLVHDLFYMKGNFYFVFKEGSVWAFDIVSHDWGEVPIDTSRMMNTRSEFQRWYTMNMVVSNGEVLLVYFCRNWKPWYIFKLDWSVMEWVKEEVLGNRALFLGDMTSLSIPTSGEIKSLAGQIHFLNKSRFNHYSFKNNGRSTNKKLKALVNKYYSYFRKDEGEYDWVWIEPYS